VVVEKSKAKVVSLLALAVALTMAGVTGITPVSAQAPGPGMESVVPGVVERGENVNLTIASSSRPAVVVNNVFDPEQSLDVALQPVNENRWQVTVNTQTAATSIYNIFITSRDTNGEVINSGLEPVDELPARRHDGVIDGFFTQGGAISSEALFFEGDFSLPVPWVNPGNGGVYAFRIPFPIVVDFRAVPPGGEIHEGREYRGDTHNGATLTLATLDGVNVLHHASSTDGRKWTIRIPNITPGRHTLIINARDEAGNTLAQNVETSFQVMSPPVFALELLPGWNLISFPGGPLRPAIDAVFPPGVPVSTVLSFDPAVRGGWLAASRPAPNEAFIGDLKIIDANRSYWVSADAQGELRVPLVTFHRGAIGGPILPPSISLRQGWNLVPIMDTSGSLEDGDVVDSDIYFASIIDEAARIFTFDTLSDRMIQVTPDGIAEQGRQEQLTIPGTRGACPTCPLSQSERVEIGKAYWVFATEDVTLIP
jgi:hypothetical protein